MPTFNETTQNNHAIAAAETRLEGVEELPPLVSPCVLSSEERKQIVETGMREIFRLKLRERWRCDEPGHDVCYRPPKCNQHIPLSENDVDLWVDELVSTVQCDYCYDEKEAHRWNIHPQSIS